MEVCNELQASVFERNGTEIFCEECGKRWRMTELGELEALSGETEFSHIPDWYERICASQSKTARTCC